jgi:hypothetical protein
VDDATADTFTDAVRETFRLEQMAHHEAGRAGQLDVWREWYFAVYLHTPHWQRLRAVVLERDPVCRGCGERTSEHVHHHTYHRLGRELLTDLVGYCRDCHERAHHHNAAMCPCVDCTAARGGQHVPADYAEALA